jgi:glycosyltransferase involved in cell wall biosynthesis
MKVLQLCLRLPWPPNDGGTIAMFSMSSALTGNGVNVKVVSFNTLKHFVEPSSIPDWYMSAYRPEMVYLDATVRPLGALLNLFSKESYNISRFDITEMHQLIETVLTKEKFDVIQLESLFMAPYLETVRKFSDAKVVFRAHNVEYLIWKRLADSENFILKKYYLKLLAKRLRRYEAGILNRFDGIIVLTDEDHDLFKSLGCHVPVRVSPISIDTADYSDAGTETDPASVFHLGSMDWMPNLEGVDWFLSQVWPLTVNHESQFKLFLAGKGMPQKYLSMNEPRIHVQGRVDHARNFMSDKQIMIVPLLSGGGMRVKIIEGMAAGKTIISTSIGAEGIQYTNGTDILIADSPADFASALIRCVKDPVYSKSIGDNARKLAVNRYDNRITGSGIIDFYKSLKKRSSNSLIS